MLFFVGGGALGHPRVFINLVSVLNINKISLKIEINYKNRNRATKTFSLHNNIYIPYYSNGTSTWSTDKGGFPIFNSIFSLMVTKWALNSATGIWIPSGVLSRMTTLGKSSTSLQQPRHWPPPRLAMCYWGGLHL